MDCIRSGLPTEVPPNFQTCIKFFWSLIKVSNKQLGLIGRWVKRHVAARHYDWLIFFFNETILRAVMAASSPLFPCLPPALSSACSMLLGVKTPKTTGLSYFNETLTRP